MKKNIITLDSKKKKEITIDVLPLTDIDDDLNSQLHLYNRFVVNRFRFSKAKTKTRSEITVTGAKAYKQKGTGNARRGVNNSPLRRGGAVAFGPIPRHFNFKLNKKFIQKMKQLLFSIILDRLKIVSSDITLKSVQDSRKLFEKENENILLLIQPSEYMTFKSVQNLPNVIIDDVRFVEPQFLLSAKSIYITENALNFFMEEPNNG